MQAKAPCCQCLNDGGAWADQFDCLPRLDHDVCASTVLRDPEHSFQTVNIKAPSEREPNQAPAKDLHMKQFATDVHVERPSKELTLHRAHFAR